MHRTTRLVVATLTALALLTTACSGDDNASGGTTTTEGAAAGGGATIRVPQDQPTIQDAVDAVARRVAQLRQAEPRLAQHIGGQRADAARV